MALTQNSNVLQDITFYRLIKYTEVKQPGNDMQILTIDPMTGNEVTTLNDNLSIIDGTGDDAIKIYFESERTLNEFIEFRKDDEPVQADSYEKIAS